MKLNGKKLKDANVVKVLDSGNLAFCSILVVRDDDASLNIRDCRDYKLV